MKSLHASMISMVSKLVLAAWLFSFAFGVELAQAQPPASGFEELPPTNAVPLTYHGVRGLWLPAEMSRQIQADVEELRALRVVSQRQDDKIEISGERFSNMMEILDLVRQEREFAVGALDEAIKGRREAEEAKDAWYRSPELWVTIGVVAGAALILVAAELVPER